MKAQGLYNPQNEHDACGVGFVLNMNGNREHGIVKKGVKKSKGYTRKPKVYHEEEFKEVYQ